MKKFVILMTVCVLCLSGCGSNDNKMEKNESVKSESKMNDNVSVKNTDKKKDIDLTKKPKESPVVQTQTPAPTMEVEKTQEPIIEETKEPVKTPKEEPKKEIENKAVYQEDSSHVEYSESDNSNVSYETEQTIVEEPVQQELIADIEESSEIPEQQNPVQASVSYSPQNVVAIATSKIKAGGKQIIPEEMNRMLAEGTISQDIYDMFYPYDGAGYYSVFVETDLNKAATTSGRRLYSEDEIAQYIADMMLLERVSSVAVEYSGVSNGQYYEFRCYR